MQLPVPHPYKNKKNYEWQTISNVNSEPFDGDVYSLEVERFEHYIADGIVTHNCLFGWLKGGTHKWYAGRSESTVWNFDKPARNSEHPTQKPLDLLAYPIKNSSKPGDIVLDTFGGSGSTLIAAEQLNRVCYMMELDEKYASVILRRFAEFTGKIDEITVERDGKTLKYADLVKEVARK